MKPAAAAGTYPARRGWASNEALMGSGSAAGTLGWRLSGDTLCRVVLGWGHLLELLAGFWGESGDCIEEMIVGLFGRVGRGVMKIM